MTAPPDQDNLGEDSQGCCPTLETIDQDLERLGELTGPYVTDASEVVKTEILWNRGQRLTRGSTSRPAGPVGPGHCRRARMGGECRPHRRISVQELKTRPDFAVTKQNLLVGFIELKAPGKGADPRRFEEQHDREQWQKLKLLPNLVYTDGNSFSLWQDGELHGEIVRLEGSVESAGAALRAPASLLRLFTDFLNWTPTPLRAAISEHERTPLSLVARRSHRADRTRQRCVNQLGRRLAANAVPRGFERNVRRWLCAGRYLRSADGSRPRHRSIRRPRQEFHGHCAKPIS